MSENGHTYEVLVIDDNPAEAHLIREAFAQCKSVRTHVSVVEDTRAVVVYLRGEMEYAGRPHPRPDLIILDYVMPVDGGIALTEIKGDPAFLMIPVIAFTASQNPVDHGDIYQRGANCCILKPYNLRDMFDTICMLADFWLKRVVPPPPPRTFH